jgi:hypothetical protein
MDPDTGAEPNWGHAKRAWTQWVLALLPLLGACFTATAALGAPSAIPFNQLGTYERLTFQACGVTMTPFSGTAVRFGPQGVGVVGIGPSISSLDGGEALVFEFPAAGATGVSYSVGSAGNENGTGDFGDAFVEAFALGGGSLGVVAVSGTGKKNLASFFGSGPISRFSITSTQDSQRIARIEFTPSPDEFRREIGSFLASAAPELSLCGHTPAASTGLYNSDLGHEIVAFGWLDVIFDHPTDSVRYANIASDGNSNGISGESFLEAFGTQGSLGIVSVKGGGEHPVSTLFGDQPITRFRVTTNGDFQYLYRIEYAPEASAAMGAIVALLSLAARARATRHTS